MENGRYTHGKEIGALESDMKGVKEDIHNILTNDLPHIDKRLRKIDNKLAYWGGVIIGVQIAVTVIFKYI